MRSYLFLVVSICALLASSAGCGTTYGSKRVSTSVSVTPDRSRVYIILDEIWNANGGEEMIHNTSLLKNYQVGMSPVKKHVKANRLYVIVAVNEDTGEFEWSKQTISKSNSKFTLQIP